MRNCYCVNFQHIVFRVKKLHVRQCDLGPLHAYIAGILMNIGVKKVKVGGIYDHVHIFGEFADKRLSDVVRQCKISATAWLRTKDATYYSGFHWGRGFGSFSISPGHVAKVRAYIAGQQEHHLHKTTLSELRKIVDSYRVQD